MPLPNVIIPCHRSVGQLFCQRSGGSVIAEHFCYPLVSAVMRPAIRYRDHPVLQVYVLSAAVR